MTKHSETRVMPYSAEEMFALISEIERYPEFLPWCAAVRERSRRMEGAREVIDAEMMVSFKVFREKFGSRVILDKGAGMIDVSYLDGPFRYLDNHWQFTPKSETSCEVNFFVDFEFKSRTLQALVGVVFHQAMQQIVRAFERRAEALYGARPMV